MCSMISMTFILVPCSCCLCRRNEKLEGILKFSDKFWRLHNSLIVDCNLPSLLDCQTRRDGLQKLKESGLIESKEKGYRFFRQPYEKHFWFVSKLFKELPLIKGFWRKIATRNVALFSSHIYFFDLTK